MRRGLGGVGREAGEDGRADETSSVFGSMAGKVEGVSNTILGAGMGSLLTAIGFDAAAIELGVVATGPGGSGCVVA